MVCWWLCWHRKILMKNIRQKQYSQFPPVYDFWKPRWGVAYVPCVTNFRAIYAWVIRWHVTGPVGGLYPIMFVLTQSYQCDTCFFCSTLRELAVSNLGQLLFCRSITWSRCRNAYRDLWIMTIRDIQLLNLWVKLNSRISYNRNW